MNITVTMWIDNLYFLYVDTLFALNKKFNHLQLNFLRRAV